MPGTEYLSVEGGAVQWWRVRPNVVVGGHVFAPLDYDVKTHVYSADAMLEMLDHFIGGIF
jgi:hypothetical protein